MNGVSKRVWLLIYQEGGWWTAAEIRQHLQLPGGSNLLHVILGDMVKANFLESKNVPDHQLELRVRFGVTAKCKVPRGVVLQEIEQILRMGIFPPVMPQP